MRRSDIKGFPRNPRKIDQYARKKLERGLKKLGLLEPVTVNKRSGFLVGGHQRLSCLDALHGDQDYLLDVSVVDLSPAQEAEAVILLNNPSAQGQWDLDVLGDLLSDKKLTLDLDATGFEALELGMMFEGTDYAALFTADDAAVEDIDTLGQMGDAASAADAADRAKQKAIEDAKKAATAKANREKMRAEHAGNDDDLDTMVIIVCGTGEERAAIMKAFGETADGEKYVDCRRVFDALKIERPATTQI